MKEIKMLFICGNSCHFLYFFGNLPNSILLELFSIYISFHCSRKNSATTPSFTLALCIPKITWCYTFFFCVKCLRRGVFFLYMRIFLVCFYLCFFLTCKDLIIFIINKLWIFVLWPNRNFPTLGNVFIRCNCMILFLLIWALTLAFWLQIAFYSSLFGHTYGCPS